MIILGLDAVDWRWLQDNGDAMPFLSSLLSEYGNELDSDQRTPLDSKPDAPMKIHSAPAWILALSGVPFGEHEVCGFIVTENPVLAMSSFPWLWHQAENPVVRQIPCTMPPMFIGCRPVKWMDSLAITKDEMIEATKLDAAAILDDLNGTDLYVSIWLALDRAGHLFWGTQGYSDVANAVDKALQGVWYLVEKQPWAVMSDHGMTDLDAAVRMETGYPTQEGLLGGHSPWGIWASNFATVEKLSEVYNALAGQLSS